MSTTTLEPKADIKAKLSPPPKYHVIFNRGAVGVRACVVNLLQEVFHVNRAQAMAHLRHAAVVGRSIILTDFHEVAEAKTEQANTAVLRHSIHNPNMNHVSFRFEKA